MGDWGGKLKDLIISPCPKAWDILLQILSWLDWYFLLYNITPTQISLIS